jgi:hypothetical protein
MKNKARVEESKVTSSETEDIQIRHFRCPRGQNGDLNYRLFVFSIFSSSSKNHENSWEIAAYEWIGNQLIAM